MLWPISLASLLKVKSDLSSILGSCAKLHIHVGLASVAYKHSTIDMLVLDGGGGGGGGEDKQSAHPFSLMCVHNMKGAGSEKVIIMYVVYTWMRPAAYHIVQV